MALAAAAILALAGCGGGAQTLSRHQLTVQAEVACRDANGRIASLREPRGLDGLAAYARGTRAITARLRRQIGALRAPSAERPAVARYLAALDRGNALLVALSTAAAAGDRGEVQALGERLVKTMAGPLAAQAGFHSCAAA